jgi:choline monooxygenase
MTVGPTLALPGPRLMHGPVGSWAMTRTLPAAWYGDPEIHERERRAVFGNEWLFVGFAQGLQEPGDYLATDIAGWNIVVVVDDEGALRAHHNVCRHRAGPLVPEGRGRVPSLVCRYHGWAYALDGKLKSARDFGDAIELIDCDALVSMQVDSWRGLVFVTIGENGAAPPLLESLGTFVDACTDYPIETFVAGAESAHELVCNWKTYADNYLEGYHIPLVHPALNKEIDAKRYRVDIDDDYRWVVHSAPARDGALNLGRWLWRWPNLAVNLYADGMNVERYDPLGPSRTRVRYSFAFADPSAAANADTVRLSEITLDEDRTICEAVQRNLDSGVYTTGVLSPRHEQGVAAFQRWLVDAIT